MSQPTKDALASLVAAEKAMHDEIEKLVERMMELKRKAAVASEFERGQIENFIKRTDKEIDEAVYRLYSLMAAEIKIVEGAA